MQFNEIDNMVTEIRTTTNFIRRLFFNPVTLLGLAVVSLILVAVNAF